MNMENSTQLIGYIGNPPTSKLTKNEKSYVEFSLATNEHYKNSSGEKATRTQWHTIEVYGNLAKRVKAFANKGDQVGLNGKLTYRQNKTIIVAAEVLFLKRGSNSLNESDGIFVKQAG